MYLMLLACYKNIGLSSHTFMQKTKCQQHSVPKVNNTPTDSAQCISITPQITAYLYVILSVNMIPFMLSQKALHTILHQTELSNGISFCQGILSVYRGRSIRQCICVPLCQVACCSCCSSFKEEITKLVYVFRPKAYISDVTFSCVNKFSARWLESMCLTRMSPSSENF